MAVRTHGSTVTFTAPFKLKGLPEEQPPGTYQVETDDEVIEGNDRTVYRRAATLLHLTRGGTTRTYTVDPRELEAALSRDAAAAENAAAAHGNGIGRTDAAPPDPSGLKPLLAARIDDTPVYDASGRKLGSLYSVHIGREDGQVRYAVISFGGLLGLGQSYHPIPFELLRVNQEKGGYTTTIDKKALDGGPSYRPDNAPIWDAAYARRISSYYADLPASG